MVQRQVRVRPWWIRRPFSDRWIDYRRRGVSRQWAEAAEAAAEAAERSTCSPLVTAAMKNRMSGSRMVIRRAAAAIVTSPTSTALSPALASPALPCPPYTLAGIHISHDKWLAIGLYLWPAHSHPDDLYRLSIHTTQSIFIYVHVCM